MRFLIHILARVSRQLPHPGAGNVKTTSSEPREPSTNSESVLDSDWVTEQYPPPLQLVRYAREQVNEIDAGKYLGFAR
jgi:hypothetical protein